MVGKISNSQDQNIYCLSLPILKSQFPALSIFPATTKGGCTLMASWAHLTKILAGGEDIYIKIQGGDEIWEKITSLALYILPCPSLSLCVSGVNKSFLLGFVRDKTMT